MYTIIKGLDGKYHCLGRVQDGNERWVEGDLEAAVKSMKRFAKGEHRERLRRRHITFLQEVQAVKAECVPWSPPARPGK